MHPDVLSWICFLFINKIAIFAEDMPHSGHKERILFPLVCIIFSEAKLHSGN